MKEFVSFVIPTPLAINFIICFNFFNKRKQCLPTINSSRNAKASTSRFIMCETNETKLFKLSFFKDRP